MDESDPKLTKLFPENLDSLCQGIKWYLLSLNGPKNLLELHPRLNTNLKKLFEENGLNSSPDGPYSDLLLDSTTESKEPSPSSDASTNNGLKGNANKDVLRKVLNHGKYYEELRSMCREKRSELEKEIIETLLSHEHELSEFSIDLNYCDTTLKMVESSLSKQFQSLEVSSNNIKKLHDESKDITAGLQNRATIVEKLRAFVKDVIITPAMIKSLCNDPINENYVALVEEFGRKSENIKTMYQEKEYPAVEFSKIQIKKMELVLIRRIFDFLSLEISNLATPKINIQMVQNTKFVTIHPLYKYLDSFPNYTNDLKKLYTYTLRKTYAHLFENYLNALENCFEKERCRELSCLLRIRSSLVAQKQNKTISYYDLNGRDRVLEEFNTQPVLPTGLTTNSLKKELIVKSFFKLLVDTCSTESQFINSFFFNSDKTNSVNKEVEGNKESSRETHTDKTMLKEIFWEVFEVISVNLRVYLRTAFDLVALVLVYCLIRFNRTFLLRRELTFFDSEMYKFETMAQERLNYLLKELNALLEKTTKNPQISTILLWNPAPFVVNTSHIVLVLLKLNQFTKKFNLQGSQMLQTLLTSIDECSEKLDPNKKSLFLINNLSPLVDSLSKLSYKSEFSSESFDLVEHFKRIEENLNSSLREYSNYLLTEFITDIINVVNREEADIGSVPKKTLILATQALEYRNLCMDFIENYEERVLTIKNLISQSFIYAPTATLVTQRVFEMFYENYLKFYNLTMEIFKESPSDWLSKMPDPSEFKK